MIADAATPFRAAWRMCYLPGMDWEPLTDAELDAMSGEEIAERARAIQKARVATRRGVDPLTDEQRSALAEAGQRVRDGLAAYRAAEAARNLQVRRLRCRYPHHRDLASHMADALQNQVSTVSRIINGSGYGAGGARATFRL